PMFTELALSDDQQLYVGGAAGLLGDARAQDIATYRALLEVLEHRAAVLDLLSQALDPRRVFVRVGEELEHPALTELALVGATYGLATRPPGSVGIGGPLRWAYARALSSAPAAALESSRFVEAVYEL